MKHEHHHDHQHGGDHDGHHGFDDPSAIVQRLEAPEREAWQKPEEVIASFQLLPDAAVAEIGAGTGYFVVRLARRFPQGTVIGLDAEPKMVAYLQQRALDLGLANLEARLVSPREAIPLTEPVDLLFCVDTLHHIPDRIRYFSNYLKHLRQGGKLVIIERSANAPEGPPAELRVSMETVEREMAEAGFSLVRTLDFLQPYQFYLEFAPAASHPTAA
jgi:cyclopropane fatty-acyl-phospholipid synthase-like methyltransferase